MDGEFKGVTGEARRGATVLVVSIYAGEGDTAPLWTERQAVTLDDVGRYTVFAGATQAEGLPREFFTSNAAQWIGVAVEGEPEQPRVRMVSVPYALTAANAETLGGLNVKDFVMTDNLAESVKKALSGDEATAAREGDPTIMGIPNRLAKFDGAGAPNANSIIFDNTSSVGIGNDVAQAKLDVAGVLRSTSLANFPISGAGMEIAFNPGSNIGVIQAFDRGAGAFRTIFLDGAALGLNVQSGGQVGVGTGSPSARLDVTGIIRTTSLANFPTSGAGVEIGYNPGGSTGVIQAYDRGAAVYRTMFVDGSTLALNVGSGGNVGIGTAAPLSKLHVTGDARVTGNVTVDGNIGAKYQDVAEWVDAPLELEAGTVVIVDPDASNRVIASPRAYDTRVAGAVSRQPGLILGERGDNDNRSMIAQSGRVIIKVDATYGAIKPGDLLVTSPTPGHAMLSKPVKVGKQMFHRPGTLVGKALEALPSGKGEILVLLTLQ